MKRFIVPALITAVTATVWPASGHAQDEAPMMDPQRPVQCVRDVSGEEWRIQCNDDTKRCIYAPNQELDSRGRRVKPLERAQRCSVDARPFDKAALKARGYTLVQGKPDAPHGWMRDDRGRVFQVNFDLKKRMYIGGGWAPQLRLDEPIDRTRSNIDFGLFVWEETYGWRRPTRHRIRAVQGQVHLAPFSGEVVLAHYDLSHRFLDPLLRVTTFVGTPRRHDLYLDLGMWTEAGNLEVHHNALADGGDATLWRFGVAQVTLDIWQSERMDSFARVRTGTGVERLYTETMGDRSAVTASSAFEIDSVLDDRGFHNLHLQLSHEAPRYFVPHPKTGRYGNRMKARFEYELIALAINDQPLSLTLGASGEKRDDLPGAVSDKWAFVADVGARFSLWAPPRPR